MRHLLDFALLITLAMFAYATYKMHECTRNLEDLARKYSGQR